MIPRRSPDPRPRRSPALLLAAALALAALLWAGRAELPEHLARWAGDGRARGTVDYAGLSAELDAAALARQLGGLPLQCQATPDGSVCEAALAQANGVPASRLRATWQQAALQSVEIDVPWWAHHRAATELARRLGAPSGNDVMAPDGRRLAAITWNLPQGTVLIARAPGWRPWRWSALRWTAAGTPAG